MWQIVTVIVLATAGIIEASREETQDLFDDYFSWKLAIFPTYYAAKGYHNYGGQLYDARLEAFDRMKDKCEHFRDRASGILQRKEDTLEIREKRYVELVHYENDLCVRGMNFKGYYFAPIDFMGGVQSELPVMFERKGFIKLDTLDDYRVAIRMLEQIPRYLDQLTILLKDGIKEGMTLANESLSKVDKQFERLQVAPEVSQFYTHFKNLKGSTKAVKTIQRRAKGIIAKQVLPAFAKLKKFVIGEYTANVRKKPGISSVPNGQEFYQGCLEYYTTIKGITPEEVHNIGLDEIKQYKQKVLKVADRMGYGNLTFKEFVQHVKDESPQIFTSKNETVDFYKGVVNQIDPTLEQIFDTSVLTKETHQLNVERIPPGKGGLAYYIAGSHDGKRKGAFFVNVENLSAMSYVTMTLTLHEGNPGHHLQHSFAKISPVPDFLRDSGTAFGAPSLPPSYTGHIEGWGMYAEYLGQELELFNDPYQLVGFYSGNLLRAGRLVVDTGIHVFGWSRQRAIDYLFDNTAMSRASLTQQVDRYITWPGQSTAYKMGERLIRQIRTNREAELGDKFDLKAFHRHVLTCKGPMEALEKCVKEEELLAPPKPIKPWQERQPNKKKKESKAQTSGAQSFLYMGLSISLSIWALITFV